MNDPEIPHDDEAERVTLGAMLVDNETIPTASGMLVADDFFRERHRMAWRAILALHAERGKADAVLLKRELERNSKLDGAGGAEGIGALLDGIPRALNIEHYAAIVRERSLARQLVRALQRCLTDCHDSGDAADVLIERAQATVFAVGQRSAQAAAGPVPVRWALDEALARMERAKRAPGSAGVRYGLDDLDALTGGMQPGELIVLGARPGAGKSAFAINVLRRAAAAGKRVLLFSLEMDSGSLGARLLSAQSGIDGWLMRTGHLSDWDINRLSETIEKLRDLPASIDDAASNGVARMLSRARRLAVEQGLDLVIVDYIQLVSSDDPSSARANRQEEVARLSRGLKLMAKALGVPVLALAQLSRKVEERADHRPQLADLRESGAIEQDADVVLFLFNASQYLETPPSIQELEIIVAKARSGPIGVTRALFNTSTQAIEDVARGGENV